MKKLLVIAVALMSTMMLHAQSKVYMTKDISLTYTDIDRHIYGKLIKCV